MQSSPRAFSSACTASMTPHSSKRTLISAKKQRRRKQLWSCSPAQAMATLPTGALTGEISRDGKAYLIDQRNKAFILVNESIHALNGLWDPEQRAVVREQDLPPPMAAPDGKGGKGSGKGGKGGKGGGSGTGHAFMVEDDDHCETPKEAYEAHVCHRDSPNVTLISSTPSPGSTSPRFSKSSPDVLARRKRNYGSMIPTTAQAMPSPPMRDFANPIVMVTARLFRVSGPEFASLRVPSGLQ
jgi:hypothetical protein